MPTAAALQSLVLISEIDAKRNSKENSIIDQAIIFLIEPKSATLNKISRLLIIFFVYCIVKKTAKSLVPLLCVQTVKSEEDLMDKGEW